MRVRAVRPGRRAGLLGGVGALLGAMLVALPAAPAASAATAAGAAPQVLYVGSFKHIATPAAVTFASIQAAVDAARPDDWILIAPGDYHEEGDMGANAPTPADLADGWYGGVDITTPGLHLRGMNRNTVIVDGTKPGSPACSPNQADQNTLHGDGRNGILVWKADGVSIDNLTVCNFLSGRGSSGNEIWWNGEAGSGPIGVTGYSGNYLTATSTYFAGSDSSQANVCATCAQYGMFSSNSSGPALLRHLYANNMSDSGIYVGACKQECDVTIDHVWMEDDALGYSGTNSGGQIVVEHSTFEDNKEGFDTNTALTGDPPPPQDGDCPGTAVSPITGTRSCWVFADNLVEDNDNPNVPVEGTAGLGPTGTGMTLSGGRNDTVMDNRFIGNDAWGILFVPYPDGNTTSDGRTCTQTGGVVATGLGIAGLSCLYDPMNDTLENNEFSDNGSFANMDNADYGNLLVYGDEPTDCFSGNTEWNSTFTTPLGAASDANAIDGFPQQTPSVCGISTPSTGLLGSNTDSDLLVQAECDSGLLSGAFCSSAVYPQSTHVVMQPVPKLPTMPNPCAGVPANLWCPGDSGGAPASQP